MRRSSLALAVSAYAALGKSTYIFVAQKAHDLVVALGRQHAVCCRDAQDKSGCVTVGWGVGNGT